MLDSVINHIRGRIISHKCGHCGKNLCVSKGVKINNPRYITFGNNVFMGKHAEIYPYPTDCFKPQIIIGDHVCIGDYNRFACADKLIIEDDVLFAAYVHISDHSHEYRDVSRPIHKQGIFSKGPVIIGKGSWLGFRSEVLSGVKIGEHCVVAAGAVVTHDVPPYSVVAGIPAKIISKYDFSSKKWISVKSN